MTDVTNTASLLDIHSIQEKKGALNRKVDVMALTYYYLLDAETTTNESALVKAKQLNANAVSQQKYNQEAGELKWVYVPNLQQTKHGHWVSKTIEDPHWSWVRISGSGKFEHCGWKWETKKNTKVEEFTYTSKNQAIVNNAQTQNQQVVAERNFLTQKMGLLQQEANIQETHINSLTDESTQTMSLMSFMLQIEKTLTYKALMRSPPQF